MMSLCLYGTGSDNVAAWKLVGIVLDGHTQVNGTIRVPVGWQELVSVPINMATRQVAMARLHIEDISSDGAAYSIVDPQRHFRMSPASAGHGMAHVLHKA